MKYRFSNSFKSVFYAHKSSLKSNPNFSLIYIGAGVILTSGSVYLVGNAFGKKGKYLNTLIGSFVGTLVGLVFLYDSLRKNAYGGKGEVPVGFFIGLISPSVGAIIGYHWR